MVCWEEREGFPGGPCLRMEAGLFFLFAGQGAREAAAVCRVPVLALSRSAGRPALGSLNVE